MGIRNRLKGQQDDAMHHQQGDRELREQLLKGLQQYGVQREKPEGRRKK